MGFSTEKMFLHKWVTKLRADLRRQLNPVLSGEEADKERAKTSLSLRIARVLNLLNFPLFWSGLLLFCWLLLELVLESFLSRAFLAPIQRYSKPLVTVVGPAAVGYWTNWLAIKMLFHPQRKNTVWWGLIHARREGLITSLAAGMQSSLISPEIIRNYLDEHGVLTRLTKGVAQALAGVLKDPAFRGELEGMIAGLLRWIINDPRTREQVDQYLESVIADLNGVSLRGKVLAWTKPLWEAAFGERVWAFLAELPERADYLAPRIMASLETIPAKLEGEAKAVESLAAELIADGLRSIDFQSVIREQLAKMDATALERLLTANICEELVFIQTSGGIFGFLVGLAILYPFLRPFFLLGGFALWGIYRLTVEKEENQL